MKHRAEYYASLVELVMLESRARQMKLSTAESEQLSQLHTLQARFEEKYPAKAMDVLRHVSHGAA